jgi:hypothetical protein
MFNKDKDTITYHLYAQCGSYHINDTEHINDMLYMNLFYLTKNVKVTCWWYSYTWICSTWQKMSKLHVGDIVIHESVLPDKKCQSYMLLVIWVYKMYMLMYLFYLTKNVKVTCWWYSYTWICSTWQKMSKLHVGDIVIHESVLPDKKCQSYMLLVIWVYKMYMLMYLFYLT